MSTATVVDNDNNNNDESSMKMMETKMKNLVVWRQDTVGGESVTVSTAEDESFVSSKSQFGDDDDDDDHDDDDNDGDDHDNDKTQDVSSDKEENDDNKEQVVVDDDDDDNRYSEYEGHEYVDYEEYDGYEEQHHQYHDGQGSSYHPEDDEDYNQNDNDEAKMNYDYNDYYGYEEASPSRRRNSMTGIRRSSLVGRIMVWSGAVNEEYFDQRDYDYDYTHGYGHGTTSQPRMKNRRATMDNTIGCRSGGGGTSSQEEHYQVEKNHRRASMDCAARPVCVPPIQRERRSHSSDEMDFFHSDNYNDLDGHYHHHHHHQQHLARNVGVAVVPSKYEDALEDRPKRRNSLLEMMDRVMGYVNLTREDTSRDTMDDDVSPFGTRRDSLF